MEVKYDIRITTIDIPLLGRCTLMPCCYEFLPSIMKTYTGVARLAKRLTLTELSELEHTQVQEIFRSISIFLSEGEVKPGTDVGIILSGIHEAYTSIDTDKDSHVKEQCVSLLDFCSWNKEGKTLSNGSFANYFEMLRDELPIDEHFDAADRNIMYCLFFGEHVPESNEE